MWAEVRHVDRDLLADAVTEVVLDAPPKLNSLDEQALKDLVKVYDDAAAAASRGEMRAGLGLLLAMLDSGGRWYFTERLGSGRPWRKRNQSMPDCARRRIMPKVSALFKRSESLGLAAANCHRLPLICRVQL